MDNFNFNKDFYAACMVFGEKDGGRLAMAFLRYGYDGIEPDGLPPALNAAFILARGRIDAMVLGSQGGRQGAKAKRSKTAKDPTQGTTQGTSQGTTAGTSQGTTAGTSLQKEKEKEKEGKEETSKDVSEKNAKVAEVIAHLNAKCGTAYKPDSETSRKAIGARLADGFTVDDCKRAIDNTAAEWLEDPDMARYLRPTTIFGKEKFEGYVNQGAVKGKAKEAEYGADAAYLNAW